MVGNHQTSIETWLFRVPGPVDNLLRAPGTIFSNLFPMLFSRSSSFFSQPWEYEAHWHLAKRRCEKVIVLLYVIICKTRFFLPEQNQGPIACAQNLPNKCKQSKRMVLDTVVFWLEKYPQVIGTATRMFVSNTTKPSRVSEPWFSFAAAFREA